MSTQTVPIAAAAEPAPPRTGYLALWRGVPRELGFLLLTMPIAIIGLSVLSSVFWTGVGTIVLVFGIFILVGSLYIARGFGVLELVRLHWAGQPRIREPRWATSDPNAGFWSRYVFGPMGNGHYWLSLLHGMIISPIVSVVSWSITVTWVSAGLGGTTFWIWGRFLPQNDRQFWLHEVVFEWAIPGSTAGLNPRLGENLFQLVVGLIFLVTLPFITRGLTLLHDGIARGLLGAWRSEELQREVADLSASRGAAVAAEDQSLRRLERDIHDGPQQRLVRLQMDLATAERRLETDPDAAKAMLAEAREQARDTLEELRALSRGFAPPILQDRGLGSALESLAARSPIPVRLETALDPSSRLPGEIERSAYFIAAELLTNAAKHSGASDIRLHTEMRSTGVGERWLDLWVIDNGSGGAVQRDGHGLAGLDERVRGLRGLMTIESPAGGPTTVGVHIPVPDAASALS